MRDKAVPARVPCISLCVIASIFATVIPFFSVLPSSSHAAVTTSITPTTDTGNLGTTIAQAGNLYNIIGGTRPGGGANLFHSFGNFSVGAGDIANFLNTPVNGSLPFTSNILGRVTGGNISNIFGTIQTTGFGNANLFLMNPAGFLFGPTATVNVGGMVAFTTADYLRLADNVRFNAVSNAAADALLSTAPVAAYGFLGSNPGAITVQGSQLSVADGTGISLVGGNITIQSGTPDGGTAQPAQLSAPNGKIQLASAASPGEFDATTLQTLPNVDGTSFASFGSVTLASGSSINLSGANTVSIRSGQFVLSVNDAVFTTSQTAGPPETISLSRGSSIVTSNSGADPGADVQLIASNVQLDGASIQSTTRGDRRGGDISITNAQSVSLTNGAQIVSDTEGASDGGNLTISTTNTPTSSVTISGFDSDGTLNGIAPFGIVASGIFSTASAGGNGGQISITARTVTVDNVGTLATITTGDGRGGNILVDAQTVRLTNGAVVLSSNGVDIATGDLSGEGRGGDITVTASDSIEISGSNPDVLGASVIFSQTFNGQRGGNIQISAPTVTLGGGTTIFTDTEGAGAGGNITVIAPTQFSLLGFDPFSGQPSHIATLTESDGQAGTITVKAGTVNMADGALIQSESFAGGNSGDLTFEVQNDLNIADGAIISSVGGASSGNISIAADKVFISGHDQSLHASRIENVNGGESNTGNITLNVRELTLTDNARINSVSGAGDGNIVIAAAESVTVSGGAKIRMDNQIGTSGLIDIAAPTITMDQGIIQTQTSGNSSGGNVNLHADNLTMSGSFINSGADNSTTSFRSGNVTINVTETLSISGQFSGSSTDIARPAGIYATAGTQGGDAGQISINASMVSLTSGARIDTSTTSFANGGPLGIIAEHSIALAGSGTGLFSGTSGPGTGGAIGLQSPQIQITDGAVISAISSGPGPAGSVSLRGMQSPAQSILISGPGSGIFTDTQGEGAGGNISVNANTVTLQNGGTLSAATSGAEPSATGGSITVNAGQFNLTNGGLITASTTGAGAGGSITIDAGNTFASNASTVRSTATQAQGGDITITAGQSAILNNGSSISASSTGAGNAGDIGINAGENFLATNSSVTTEANNASGGAIKITTAPSGTVQLINSTISASVLDGTGGGGSVNIDPQYVILLNSQILAQAVQGPGGNISITTNFLLPDATSVISASSQFGVNGTVTIQSPNAPISGQIQPLGKTPLIATSLLNQRCAALAGGEFSSFTMAGRDSLPTEPGGWLSSPLYAAGTGLGGKAEGARPVARGEGLEDMTLRSSLAGEPAILSLRQIAPAGFLTQSFAVEGSASCQS